MKLKGVTFQPCMFLLIPVQYVYVKKKSTKTKYTLLHKDLVH